MREINENDIEVFKEDLSKLQIQSAPRESYQAKQCIYKPQERTKREYEPLFQP
jgi:hypothetical protein